MKKLFLVLIVTFLICSASFAENGFQPYTGSLSNKKLGETLTEFEDSTIKITRNKYQISAGMIEDPKASIYEYLITNKSENPIILKNMIVPDRITQYETSYYTFHNYKNDLLINTASAVYLGGKVSLLDKFFQPLPSDYLINTNDTIRILLLSKIYLNPLVEFQFVINDNLKTIMSSVAYIVKDDKYYQEMVGSQNIKYKYLDIIGCIENNDIHLIEAYLKTGLDPNHRTLGVPLLLYALDAHNPKIVDVFLKAGANPNQQYMGNYPLTDAIIDKKTEIAKMLIDAGADPNQKCIGTYPLIWAIKLKQQNVVYSLLTKGADPNVQYLGKTALIYAIEKEQPEIAKMLIDNGVDINKNKGKKYPLSYALKKKQELTAVYLINAGAKIDEKCIKYSKKLKDENLKNLILSKSIQN